MEENNSRKVFLSVLGVAILIVAVVGISFAAYTLSGFGSGTNTIQTGTITMSYAEPSQGINIADAVPMKDSAARTELVEAGEVFTFTVNAKANGTVTIPYEINIEKLDASTLPDTSVKIELTTGTVGDETEVVAPMLMSALRVDGNASTLRTGTHTIKDETVVYTNGIVTTGAETTTYNLRIWVDNDVDTANSTAYPEAGTYKIKVHVDSHVNPIGA